MGARGLLAVALAAALSTPVDGAAVRAKPLRIMSISQCTDQIVLALVPPERIASVTWLSRDPASSLMARQALRVGVNHGLAEEVVRQRPDLIVADSYAMPGTRALLKRLGYPVVEVDSAENFAAIRTVTRRIAAAVGETARGERLIARMNRQLAGLARDRGARMRVAAWDGSGFGARKGSLYAAVLEAAGADNIADRLTPSSRRVPDAELLLAAAPMLLVQGARDPHRPSLKDNIAQHPLVRRYWSRDRIVTLPQTTYFCGTPFVADAAMQLRADLRAAAARGHTPLPFTPR